MHVGLCRKAAIALLFDEFGEIMLHFTMSKKKVFIYTYGCQMNVHDTEKMLGVLSEKGYETAERPEDAGLIIFNTCAIREKAEQKFYSQLGRTGVLKRKRNDLRIAVAGCVAQDSGKRIFGKAPYVDFVVGPQNVHMIDTLVSRSGRAVMCDANDDLAFQTVDVRRQSRTKAWVTIMFGCNNFCSYCIVPYTRGREVSRPSSAILSEIERLRAEGYSEVTLLGQNVNSYRSDLDFPGLLSRIDAIGIPRVRFVTSHPRDLSSGLIQCMADLPSLCEHIHLPLQSGSDRVLRMMNRGYGYADYVEKIVSIRSAVPSLSITTDIICGFPGETDEDYMLTVKALEEVRFDGIFAFKYSARKGTRAFTMEDHIGDEIKSERLNVVLKLQEDITLQKNRALEGTVQEVLIDGPSETDASLLAGRTRSNKIVTIPNDGSGEGEMLRVRIERARLHSLCGMKL
jgi:tRNA-2-methylthio-N6-dimethylallyladenosine synthase